MWAINVVVVDVLGEERIQVSLVDDDRVVQTLRAYWTAHTQTPRQRKPRSRTVRGSGGDRDLETQFVRPRELEVICH